MKLSVISITYIIFAFTVQFTTSEDIYNVLNDESDEIKPPINLEENTLDFNIEGPDTIQLPIENITFKVVFSDETNHKEDGEIFIYESSYSS